VAPRDPLLAESLRDLAQRWFADEWQQPWRTILPLARAAALERWWRWYVRAYMLTPAELRGNLVDPREVEPRIAADEIRRFAEGTQATVTAAGDVLYAGADAARDLRDYGTAALAQIRQLVGQQSNTAAWIEGGVAVVGLTGIVGYLAWRYRA